MEEKKVNDDVIIKALLVASEGFSNLYNGNLYKDALDLIKRLQNIEKANEEAWEIKEESYKRQIAEQKTEIERLTKNAKYWERKHCNAVREWEVEVYNRGLKIIELQKQVDELTEQLKKLKLAHTSLCDECADYCPRVPQAVKNTAKEICDFILECWEKKQFVECDWLRVEISERYGVEISERYGVEVD